MVCLSTLFVNLISLNFKFSFFFSQLNKSSYVVNASLFGRHNVVNIYVLCELD